jgi:UDP-N-acetylglucosamine transferase subunit ALG13
MPCSAAAARTDMGDPIPGRQLLVATTGGHLAELVRWAPKIGADPDSLWVTFESPQSNSLLRDRRVLHVPYVAPRALLRTAKAFKVLLGEIDWRSEHFTAAVSTGAAVGLAGLAAARLHHVPSFYIECGCHVDRPGLTGRLVQLDPRISTSCQYDHWDRPRWKYRGSLLDDFVAAPKCSTENPRLFVTLGTIRPYRFDALVDAVLATGFADDRTVWQLGATSRVGLPGTVVSEMSRSEFEECAGTADVVVTHAGIGSLLDLLDLDVYPVVVPRRARRAEHINDHQLQIARLAADRGISLVTEVEALDRSTIVQASAMGITKQGVKADAAP